MKFLFTILIATAIFLSTLNIAADPAKTTTVQEQQTSNSEIKSLLRSLELDYIELDNGVLKVTIESDNEISIILINTGYLVEDDPSTLSCYIITIVAKKNNNRMVSDALFNNLNRINTSLDLGQIIYNNDKNVCYYFSRIWMKNLDKNVLLYELAYAHIARTKYRRELTNYLNQ